MEWKGPEEAAMEGIDEGGRRETKMKGMDERNVEGKAEEEVESWGEK
jgi:hypothetical protein